MTTKTWETRRKNGNDIPWNKGKKGSQVAWNKGLSLKKFPSMGFQKGHPGYLVGKAREQSIENHKGEKHWNWKGGLTPLVARIRHWVTVDGNWQQFWPPTNG